MPGGYRTFEHPLTPRELEVLHHIATGLTNHQIALECSIGVETVKVHVKHLLRKLGATNRTEAVRIALEHGLLQLGGGGAHAATIAAHHLLAADGRTAIPHRSCTAAHVRVRYVVAWAA